MHVLDIRTVLVSYILTIALCTVFMWSLWQQAKNRVPETRCWFAGFVLQCTGLVLVTIRDYVRIFPVSSVLGSCFILAGTMTILHGLERFFDLASSRKYNYGVLPLFALAMTLFVLVRPNLSLSSVTMATGLLFVNIQMTFLFLFRVKRRFSRAARPAVLIFIFLVVVSIIHIVSCFTIRENQTLFSLGLIESLVVLSYQALTLCMTLVLYLLVNRTLMLSIESELQDLRKTKKKLGESEQKLSKIFHASPNSIIISRPDDGTILDANDSSYEFFRVSPEENPRGSLTTIPFWVHPEEREQIIGDLDRNIAVKNREFLFRRKDGEIRTCLYTAQYLEIGRDRCILSDIKDITDRIEQEKRIIHLANHDPLTGLPTLRLVKDRLSSAISLAQRHRGLVGVLFIDLDGFKAVNDTYGHDVGDQVLTIVSARLPECIRSSDTAARIGGDEFLILLAELQNDGDAELVAEKIVQSLGMPMTVPNPADPGSPFIDIKIGASIGISTLPRDGDDIDTLIKKADRAMYTVKRRDKNGFALASDR